MSYEINPLFVECFGGVTGQRSNQLNYVPTVESTTCRKALWNDAVARVRIFGTDISHTAHCSFAVHTMASVPAKTANKPPIKISALMRIHTSTDACKRRNSIPNRGRYLNDRGLLLQQNRHFRIWKLMSKIPSPAFSNPSPRLRQFCFPNVEETADSLCGGLENRGLN